MTADEGKVVDIN